MPEKYVPVSTAWSSVVQIGNDGVADRGGEGKSVDPPALGHVYGHGALAPVDVTEG
jgi:hypothetical protein